MNLSRVKRLLNINGNGQDQLLEDIMEMAEAQLKNRLGGVESIPAELEYIVINVAVSRFNQIGDEGKGSMTVEGESATWLIDLFVPFETDIQKYLDRQNETVSGGYITFL